MKHNNHAIFNPVLDESNAIFLCFFKILDSYIFGFKERIVIIFVFVHYYFPPYLGP